MEEELFSFYRGFANPSGIWQFQVCRAIMLVGNTLDTEGDFSESYSFQIFSNKKKRKKEFFLHLVSLQD